MPSGLILRQVQKNEVLHLLVGAGLIPSQFDWSSRTYTSGLSQGSADLLTHRDSGFFYEFTLVNGSKHHARMSPGAETIEAMRFPGTWEFQLDYLAQWAMDLKAELAAPDLWDSINESHVLHELPSTFEGNTRFSPSEISQLSERLDVIGSRLAEVVDREDLQSVADELVEHLREEISKQGRWDWFFLATGALMNFMANAAFEPHRAKELIQILMAGIRSLGPG